MLASVKRRRPERCPSPNHPSCLANGSESVRMRRPLATQHRVNPPNRGQLCAPSVSQLTKP